MKTQEVTAEEAARLLRELHPLTAERVQRIAALLLSSRTDTAVAA